MMRSMGTDAASIGSGMALALITTLYGSVLANWVCIPISRRMEKNGGQESLVMELTIEGVLSIQAGESPTIIKRKITGIFRSKRRIRRKQNVYSFHYSSNSGNHTKRLV